MEICLTPQGEFRTLNVRYIPDPSITNKWQIEVNVNPNTSPADWRYAGTVTFTPENCPGSNSCTAITYPAVETLGNNLEKVGECGKKIQYDGHQTMIDAYFYYSQDIPSNYFELTTGDLNICFNQDSGSYKITNLPAFNWYYSIIICEQMMQDSGKILIRDTTDLCNYRNDSLQLSQDLERYSKYPLPGGNTYEFIELLKAHENNHLEKFKKELETRLDSFIHILATGFHSCYPGESEMQRKGSVQDSLRVKIKDWMNAVIKYHKKQVKEKNIPFAVKNLLDIYRRNLSKPQEDCQ